MPQNRFQAYREANPHLFGVDSDYSDSESEHEETEENQETQNHENEETYEVTDNETIKSALHFEQISNFVSQRGRPSNYIPENEPTFRFISENAYNRPLDLLLETYGNKIFSEIVIGTNEKIEKLNQAFLLDLAKNLLPKEKTEIVLPPLHNPLLGLPLDGKENRNYQKRNGICDICEKGKQLRTRNRCSKCRKYICSKHQQKTVYFICTNCKPSK